MLRRWIFFFCVLSCGTSQGTLEITTGGESDVFTKDPKPTQLVVETFGTDGSSTRIGQAALPATTLALADQKKTAVATIRVTARDDQNAILATGSSLLLELGVLSDRTLQIFVQRNGELARMPQVIGDAREDPTLAILGGRYVFVVGGGLGVKTQIYDLMSLVALVNPPDMPFVPKSVAPLDIGEILIGDTEAMTYDFSKATDAAVTPVPLEEGSWGEISGGPTVEGETGTQYVVGPARTSGPPTSKVLQVNRNGTKKMWTISQPRVGAAACWVPNRGLVISGSTMGMAGIDVVIASSGATQLTTAPMPAGVCAPLDGSKIVVATGTMGQAQKVDLSCTPTCPPTPWGGTLANAPIQMFSSTANDVFVLADAMDGTTHAYRMSEASSVEVAFKIPRKRARGLRLPTGSVGVVGGSTTIESFLP